MNFPDNSAGVYADPRITSTSMHWFGDPRRKHPQTHVITTIGTQKPWFPRYDPRIIADSADHACDSAGFFWVYKHHGRVRNINRVADCGLDSSSIGRVSVLVNGGGNGFYERQAFALVASECLHDKVERASTKIFTPSGRQIPIIVDLETLKGD
jgi:hypothetical protein